MLVSLVLLWFTRIIGGGIDIVEESMDGLEFIICVILIGIISEI